MQFNIEERQFSSNSSSAAALGAVSNAISDSIRSRANRNKLTFWGNFNGKNAAIKRRMEMEHELRMARLKSRTDGRTMIKDYLKDRSERKRDDQLYNRGFERERYRDSRDDRRENSKFKREVKRHELGMDPAN